MKNKIIKLIILAILVYGSFWVGLIKGAKETQNGIYKEFDSVQDCIVQVHYYYNEEDLGIHWSISDLQLHQKIEERDRDCAREVGDTLHTVLEKLK